MKSINNLNTLNALIKDETMASKEYKDLAMGKDVPLLMKEMLLKMSADENRHKNNLVYYREYLKKSQ
jgi:hypothetical protein